MFKGFLNSGRYNIIAILVKHYTAKYIFLLWLFDIGLIGLNIWIDLWSFAESIEYQLMASLVRFVKESFNNFGWELRITVKLYIEWNNFSNFIIDITFLEINYFADNVISKLIIYEFRHISDNFIYQLVFLLCTSSLEACLHYTASLLVSSYF